MTNSAVDYCQKYYFYMISFIYILFIYLLLFLECQIEVIFDIEKQNELISTCHSRILNTNQSKASSGDYGTHSIVT